MTNAKKFSFFFPGSCFPAEFYGKDEASAREAARSWLGVKRLPRGTFVEPYNYKSAEFIRKSNQRMVEGTGLATTDLY